MWLWAGQIATLLSLTVPESFAFPDEMLCDHSRLLPCSTHSFHLRSVKENLVTGYCGYEVKKIYSNFFLRLVSSPMFKCKLTVKSSSGDCDRMVTSGTECTTNASVF